MSQRLAMAAALSVLAACGGSGGSNGGGQKPDPVVVDHPIAYIERPIPVDANGAAVYPSVLDPIAFNAGAKLLLKQRATVQASAINITDSAFAAGALYDVKDVSANSTGDRLVFAMRAPQLANVDADEQPTWNIWEYNLNTTVLRRIITANIVAEAGQDISPQYLPSGDIVFSSTRQTRSKAVLLDDGKPQFAALEESGQMPAFSLHTIKDDGSDIQQISFNQSHDLQPSVLQDGRILFTRWDRFGHNKLSLYTVNPDGSQLERHYGFFSLNETPAEETDEINRLFKPQQLPDGRIAAILKPNAALLGGDMVTVDIANFFENELTLPGLGNSGAEAQQPISILPINIQAGSADAPAFSKHGRFAALSPLYDGSNRLLVSWSECRLREPARQQLVPCTDVWLATAGVKEAAPLYGIWVFNVSTQTQQPVAFAQEGKVLTEPVAMEVRSPARYYQPVIDPDLAKDSVGLLRIRSVYDMDGGFSNYGVAGAPSGISALAQADASLRPARFIRFIKAVSIPDNNTRDTLGETTYGDIYNQFGGRKEILGYAPVEPDGSVQVKVPADVAFGLEVLDKDGKRISATHNNWLQLRPGEVRECSGCHSSNNLNSGHGRPDAQLASINSGASTSGAPFPNTLRFDALATPQTANMGETMAEFAARSTYCAVLGDAASCAPFSDPIQGTNLRSLSVDLVFDDEWTNPSLRAKSPSFAYRYRDLVTNASASELHAPTSETCHEDDGWSSLCRITINYEQHIQPLWERPRVVNATDYQCSRCHTSLDNAGAVQVPAGQLSFSRSKVAANSFMLSYNQLLDGRDKQILSDGGVLTTQIPVCEFVLDNDEIPECVVTRDIDNIPTCAGVSDCQFERDPNLEAPEGTLLIDMASGNPIPLMTTIGLRAPMSRNGARASATFFSKFTQFDATNETIDHRGLLNNSELKVLSEWLDTRANYYNDPFASIETN